MKKRVGFVSNSSSSSFIVHQPRGLTFKEFEEKVIGRYARILSVEVKRRIFQEYKNNKSTLKDLVESLISGWGWDLNSTNSHSMTSFGFMPCNLSAEMNIAEAGRFLGVELDAEKIRNFQIGRETGLENWQEKQKLVVEYTEEIMAKINEDEFCIMEFDDSSDPILEHTVLPQLEVLIVSHH